MPKSDFNIDPAALRAIADQSPILDEMVAAVARKGVRFAKEAFEAVQRQDNEWRLSETTPPKYLGSFFTRRIKNGVHQYGNDDSAWVWVEYGAHAGGRTEVLDYRPLGRSIDRLAMED